MKKLIVGIMLVILIVTGCAGKTSQEDTNGGGSSNESKPEKVKLNLLIAQPRFREQYETYLDAFVEKYEAEKGIKVTYELEMPSADTAGEILKTRLSTSDDLDVFNIHAINDKAQYDKAGYLEDLSSEAWVEDLYDSAREAVMVNDKVIALPLESLSWGILYNKDLFDELGLEPALTMTDMKKNIEAIKGAGKMPFLASYNEAWIPQLFLSLTVGAFSNTSNTDFVEQMNTDKASFSDIQDMFHIIDLVHENANTDGLEIGGTDGCAEFASGDYGMWVQGPWFSSTILESDPDFNIGVAPLPVNDNADASMINASVSTSLAVNALSKNKEVAKDLVAYFLNPDTSTDFFTATQFNPLSSIHAFEIYPWVNEAIAYVEQGKSYVDASIPPAVKDEAGKVLQSYYAGIATQEDVIMALDEAWKMYNEINK